MQAKVFTDKISVHFKFLLSTDITISSRVASEICKLKINYSEYYLKELIYIFLNSN